MTRAGVFLEEIDLSTVVPSFAGVYGAIILEANKGPVDKPLLVTNERQLLDWYTANGAVATDDDVAFWSALAHLQRSNKLWVGRAERYAGVAASIILEHNVNDFTTTNLSIVSVVVGTKTFLVTGDLTERILPGSRIEIKNNTSNNGFYNVDAVIYQAPNTEITVKEVIPTADADGNLTLLGDTLTVNVSNDYASDSYAITLEDRVPQTGLLIRAETMHNQLQTGSPVRFSLDWGRKVFTIPDIVTNTTHFRVENHGLVVGDRIRMESGGFPTVDNPAAHTITATTDYYVYSVVDTNIVELSTEHPTSSTSGGNVLNFTSIGTDPQNIVLGVLPANVVENTTYYAVMNPADPTALVGIADTYANATAATPVLFDLGGDFIDFVSIMTPTLNSGVKTRDTFTLVGTDTLTLDHTFLSSILVTGTRVDLDTDTALPTELDPTEIYYVNKVSATDYTLHLSEADAIGGINKV
jgi:hypothetical protein